MKRAHSLFLAFAIAAPGASAWAAQDIERDPHHPAHHQMMEKRLQMMQSMMQMMMDRLPAAQMK